MFRDGVALVYLSRNVTLITFSEMLSTTLADLSENTNKAYACIHGYYSMSMNFSWSSGYKLKCWVRHMYHGHQFATPAILWQLIFMQGSLHIIYRTFRVTIKLDPEEFRKRLINVKNYKNHQIQLLCANERLIKTHRTSSLTVVPNKFWRASHLSPVQYNTLLYNWRIHVHSLLAQYLRCLQ